MRPLNIIKYALLAVPFILGACKSTKTVENTVEKGSSVYEKKEFLHKVSDTSQDAKFITSKIRFNVQVGAQDLTLTGNLKMKRDEVIRLQLMAFGFVEAGRLEFTKDYVLIMDRINKQYMKANYEYLSFLRNSGINFYTLQALFWNELFQPGTDKLTEDALNSYGANFADDDAVISYDKDKLSYRWLADKSKAKIKMANVIYKDRIKGNTQLNWDYNDFEMLGTKLFPKDNAITFTTPKKEVKINLKLNYIGNESDWETQTEVSAKYKEVMVDDILRRFMAL